MTAAAAVSTTRKVSIRLPNSTAWWMPATSGCGTGVKLPGKHCGQVGHPSPEAVTRTMAPVTAMPPWVRITQAAMMRWVRRLGIGSVSTSRRKSRPTATVPIVEQCELRSVVGPVSAPDRQLLTAFVDLRWIREAVCRAGGDALGAPGRGGRVQHVVGRDGGDRAAQILRQVDP